MPRTLLILKIPCWLLGQAGVVHASYAADELFRSYTWGRDLSGGLQGGGGDWLRGRRGPDERVDGSGERSGARVGWPQEGRDERGRLAGNSWRMKEDRHAGASS
jgi:hypothetical protein